jgi:hypothetical protein
LIAVSNNGHEKILTQQKYYAKRIRSISMAVLAIEKYAKKLLMNGSLKPKIQSNTHQRVST